jgi:6-phospho-3-hexuloisomerase
VAYSKARATRVRLMHLGLSTSFIDDMTTPAITVHDLLVIGSGSGRTASLVHYAERAKEIGAKVALVTIDPSSPIAVQANCVVQINAPTPKLAEPGQTASIQPMGTLFEQSLGIFMDAIIIQLMQSLGILEATMFERHANLE